MTKFLMIGKWPVHCIGSWLVLTCVLSLASGFVHSSPEQEPEKEQPQTDLRIVVDVSRGMAEADPDNLRGAGVELLSRNLGDDQYGGVWAYSQLTQQLVKYGPSDGLWQQMAAIHGRNLHAQSQQADLPGAVQAATWDLKRPDRRTTHMVLFSNGHIDTGLTPLEHKNQRQLLLNTWAAQLRKARVTVHTVSIHAGSSSDPPGDKDLLRQVSELSGGLHKSVTNKKQLQSFLLDVVQLMQIAPQAVPDAHGRFQVAPGAATMTAVWLSDGAGATPVLIQPDGSRLDRLSPLPEGRWVLAQDFEMVTIQQPQVGWWQLDGVQPQRLSVLGELEIRVDGISTPVIPTEESHALIRLFSGGELISDANFLRLLDVRAWLSDEHKRVPLPIDTMAEGSLADGFQAYFVNLADGAYELAVEVTAPTFRRVTKVPFVAANPLRVDFKKTADDEVVAWLNFSHAAVDYSTVRAAAKIRKPPHVGTIVPAIRMPAGLYQIPVKQREGVVEISFTISGNYLNKKGFFLKTRAQTITLPMQREVSFRFAADGKLLSQATGVEQPQPTPAGTIPPPASTAGLTAASAAATDPELAPLHPGAASEEAPWPKLPLWFVGLITLLNAGIGGLVWWLKRPAPLPLAEPAVE